ncbi:hypothetical protein [Salininema proteolyticum]|uniref:DUF4830 domain-containing protein n=1 Tax=Salininema proteolyticum TaxID=1607685 RepID=A0ABV8U344_9ACTN
MKTVLKLATSRYGIVVGIIVLVGAVLFTVDKRVSGPLTNDQRDSEASSSDTESSYGDELGDDSVAFNTAPTSLPDEAIGVANDFLDVYLDVEGKSNYEWLAAMNPFITTDLRESLLGFEPENLPAREVVGEPAIDGKKVTVQLDNGTLSLLMMENLGDYGRSPVIVGIDWVPDQ